MLEKQYQAPFNKKSITSLETWSKLVQQTIEYLEREMRKVLVK